MSEDKISMNHGAGGEVMANLISSAVLDNITKKSVNGGISLDALDDGATIPIGDYEIVVAILSTRYSSLVEILVGFPQQELLMMFLLWVLNH